ncbi:hypothetical protein TrRE_jg1318, partial [Triparma retinervis]
MHMMPVSQGHPILHKLRDGVMSAMNVDVRGAHSRLVKWSDAIRDDFVNSNAIALGRKAPGDSNLEMIIKVQSQCITSLCDKVNGLTNRLMTLEATIASMDASAMNCLKDLVAVLKTSDENTILEKVTHKVWTLAEYQYNKNRLFNEEGLVEGLARVIKKYENDKTFLMARVTAIGALRDMTYGSSIEQRTSVYNILGLMAAVVRAMGRVGEEDHETE